MNPVIVTFCTCPDQDAADKIARHLIEKQLAACVNILPQITSVYRWHEQLETSQELLLVIKSPSSSYPDIEKAIQSLHPYELPEIIALPVVKGASDYLHWINSCHTAS